MKLYDLLEPLNFQILEYLYNNQNREIIQKDLREDVKDNWKHITSRIYSLNLNQIFSSSMMVGMILKNGIVYPSYQ